MLSEEEKKQRKAEYDRKYYLKNRERILLRSAENAKKWRIKNRAGYLAIRYARVRGLRQATPKWITAKHKMQIRHIYDQAKDCEVVSGEKYHVDHIVPLKHPLVCGLHVPWNLQVLPAYMNDAKGNKLMEDYDVV